MKVKIFNKSNNPLPKYQTPLSAGMDLMANIDKDFITIQPGETRLIPTGLHIQLPPGYEAQVRPRSGLAYKFGLTVLNTPGTIDADYTGDIGVILINHGQKNFMVQNGDRIAQLVIAKHENISWEPVETQEELAQTERGEGGFGHTGTN